VDHPALTIKHHGALSRAKLGHPAGRPAGNQCAYPSATAGKHTTYPGGLPTAPGPVLARRRPCPAA